MKCANCGKAIEDFADAYEEEIDGELLFFDSERCAKNYKKKLKQREDEDL